MTSPRPSDLDRDLAALQDGASTTHEQQVRERIAQISLDAYERAPWDVDAWERVADAILAEFPILAQEPEYEYGVTTKWGIGRHGAHREEAEDYAVGLRDSIQTGRESGDLTYHGIVMRRKTCPPGPWLPVADDENGEGA